MQHWIHCKLMESIIVTEPFYKVLKRDFLFDPKHSRRRRSTKQKLLSAFYTLLSTDTTIH